LPALHPQVHGAAATPVLQLLAAHRALLPAWQQAQRLSAMQLPTPTPQFVFFANLPQYVKEPYKRFLENKIRENWDFSGVPIDIYIREK
jgi:predicted GTPase